MFGDIMSRELDLPWTQWPGSAPCHWGLHSTERPAASGKKQQILHDSNSSVPDSTVLANECIEVKTLLSWQPYGSLPSCWRGTGASGVGRPNQEAADRVCLWMVQTVQYPD